jgi:hypothetical protein
MLQKKNSTFSTKSLIKLPNTFELSTISSFQNNAPNLKTALALLFFFILLYVNTNIYMVVLFIILSEVISALPYKLNSAGVLSLVSFKFFITALFCFISPLNNTLVMYGLTASSSLFLLSLRDERERSLLLTIHNVGLLLGLEIFNERLLTSIKDGIAFLGTKAGKKIIWGFGGPAFSGSTLYLLAENERASVKAQYAEIEKEATFLKENVKHTISLVKEGMLDKETAQKSIFNSELQLRALEIKHQNVLPPGQKFVNKVLNWVNDL